MIEAMSGRSSVCAARVIVLSDGLDAFEKAVAADARVRIVVKMALYMMSILEVLSIDVVFGMREDMRRIC